MRLMENGNLSSHVRALLIVVGIGIGVVSFIWCRSIILMSVGLGVAAIGGYASKAHQLNIKPFDNSYERARESYRGEDRGQDQSK